MELDRLTQMVSFPGEVETHVGAKCSSSEGGEAFRMRTNGRKKHCKHMNTNEKLLLESQSVVCGEIPGKKTMAIVWRMNIKKRDSGSAFERINAA